MNKTLKNLLFWGGAFTIIFVVCKNKPLWLVMICIFAWAGLLGLVSRLIRFAKAGKAQEGQDEKPKDPRLDSPDKALRAATNYFISNLLFLLNPFLQVQMLLQFLGMLREKGRHPVMAPENYRQKGSYILPVTGEWHIVNGGATPETSHSWGIPSQRFAYDLVKCGPNNRSFSGKGRKLVDYFCYNAPIVAPGDGLVIKVRDGIHDAPFIGTFWMDCFTRDIAGNSVLIKHAEGEFCLLAHLKPGSICVKAGETVKQGQEIGRCGHSGNSTEPHLHFQFQDGESFYFNSGLPIKFSRFWRRDNQEKSFVEEDYLSKKFFVSTSE